MHVQKEHKLELKKNAIRQGTYLVIEPAPRPLAGGVESSAPVFPRQALVRVLGHVFSVAGWRCCPALRFSVACTWTRTMLCLERKVALSASSKTCSRHSGTL